VLKINRVHTKKKEDGGVGFASTPRSSSKIGAYYMDMEVFILFCFVYVYFFLCGRFERERESAKAKEKRF
jgi:hypothetical protein